MKSKLFSLFIGLTFMLLFIMPTFAYSNSYDYSFTMNYRVVDGSANGQFYSLNSGKAKIEGYTKIIDSVTGALGPYDINYTLYKSVFGPDPSYGTINGGIDTSFSGTFSGTITKSDKYYLLIWKVEDDGHDVRGAGKLYN